MLAVVQFMAGALLALAVGIGPQSDYRPGETVAQDRPDPRQRPREQGQTLADLLTAPQRARADRRKVEKQAQDRMMIGRLRGVRVPMIPDVRVLPASAYPGAPIESAAAADAANGIVYRAGPLDRYTMAHETAHLLEARMTDADRRRFALVMGRPNQPWDVGSSNAHGDSQQTTGYRGSLSERFADLTAMLAIDRDPQGLKVDAMYLDKMPSRKRLLRFGRSLERFGARNGLPEYVRPRYSDRHG